MKKDGI